MKWVHILHCLFVFCVFRVNAHFRLQTFYTGEKRKDPKFLCLLWLRGKKFGSESEFQNFISTWFTVRGDFFLFCCCCKVLLNGPRAAVFLSAEVDSDEVTTLRSSRANVGNCESSISNRMSTIQVFATYCWLANFPWPKLVHLQVYLHPSHILSD